jgi:hypothetical protein
MKWYVFAEGDTSILWSTLQAYLASMDHTQPHYLGSSTNIGDDPAFAYGGAGFIVSQPAMRMVADYYSTHKAQIEITTENAWAGDAVLGRIFFDAGVPVKDIWPVVHGASTSQALFARPFSPGVPKEAEQVWCYPAASLHHMSPAAVNSLWHYEQKWLEQRVNVSWPSFGDSVKPDYVSNALSTGSGAHTPQGHLQGPCHSANDRLAHRLGQSQRPR